LTTVVGSYNNGGQEGPIKGDNFAKHGTTSGLSDITGTRSGPSIITDTRNGSSDITGTRSGPSDIIGIRSRPLTINVPQQGDIQSQMAKEVGRE
jgi:hypothetical protein